MLRPPSRLRHRRGAATGRTSGDPLGADVPPVESPTGHDDREPSPTAGPAATMATTPTGSRPPALTLTRRPGTFVMTDEEGHEVGVIQGDYVIGFTVRYLGRARFIKDLDEAKAEVTRAWLEQRAG